MMTVLFAVIIIIVVSRANWVTLYDTTAEHHPSNLSVTLPHHVQHNQTYLTKAIPSIVCASPECTMSFSDAPCSTIQNQLSATIMKHLSKILTGQLISSFL